MPHPLFQTKIMQRLEDLSKDFKALHSRVTNVDIKTGVSKFSFSIFVHITGQLTIVRVISKELSSQDEYRNQRIVSLEGSILKAGDAEFKIQQALTKFEDQMDGLAIKIANLASQVIAKCDPST